MATEKIPTTRKNKERVKIQLDLSSKETLLFTDSLKSLNGTPFRNCVLSLFEKIVNQVYEQKEW